MDRKIPAMIEKRKIEHAKECFRFLHRQDGQDYRIFSGKGKRLKSIRKIGNIWQRKVQKGALVST